MKRKTVYTLLVIVLALSFFITPIGYWSKVGLMRLFASSPEIIEAQNQQKIPHYDWRLKDAEWDYFNFEKSKAKVIFIHFWASWHIPSVAELEDIQKLYDDYGDKVEFYIVTNEERLPVEEFMRKNKYTFPITYRIVNEPAPFDIPEPSGTYIIDRNGTIVVQSTTTKDWYNKKVTQLLDSLFRQI